MLLGVVIGLGVALILLIILLVLTNNKNHKSNAATTTTSPSTSTTSTSSTSTSTSTTSSTTTTSTTSTTEAPTTTVASTGTHAPTVVQTQQITAAAAADSSPSCQATDIVLSNSDPTWAAVQCTDPSSQQKFQEVRQQQGSTWVRISYGTAQVGCGVGVPPNVQADFASVLGTCPS